MIDKGQAWVKLSGAYSNTKVGPPTYADATKIAQAFVKAAPERLVWGSDWPHPGVGEPTVEYRKLFETGIAVYDQAIAELKPGMSGRDVNQWMERFRASGYVAANSAPLVNGWSTYNHAPHFGAITPPSERAYPTDADFVLQPGHCIGIRTYPISSDKKKAVWMGSTCVMTQNGLRKLHTAPVNSVRVVPA